MALVHFVLGTLPLAGSNLLVNRITRKGGLKYIGTLSRKNSVGFMFVSLLNKGQFFLLRDDPFLKG